MKGYSSSIETYTPIILLCCHGRSIEGRQWGDQHIRLPILLKLLHQQATQLPVASRWGNTYSSIIEQENEQQTGIKPRTFECQKFEPRSRIQMKRTSQLLLDRSVVSRILPTQRWKSLLDVISFRITEVLCATHVNVFHVDQVRGLLPGSRSENMRVTTLRD